MSIAFCKSCLDSKSKQNGVCLLSKENGLDPFSKGYPYDLPKLNTIEELIISKMFVIMCVYRLDGGN